MPRSRIRAKPEGPDGWDVSLEDQIYQVLRRSFDVADAAARATARLEFDLAKDLNVQPEESDQEELGKGIDQAPGPEIIKASLKGAGQEFDTSEFDAIFSSLNTMKLMGDLLDILKLSDLKQDLFRIVMEDRFRSKPSYKVARGDTTKQLVGTDQDVLLHNIKRLAERLQRSRGGNGATKATE